MSVHLEREIQRLKKTLLALSGIVEEQVQAAIHALMERDPQLARRVQQRDMDIDHREVEVEEECLKSFALYQPVASDLRFLVAAMKINSDLERIGDLAVNIARKVVTFCQQTPIEIPFDLAGMWQKTQRMLRDALDAQVNLDAPLAHAVCARDNEVDHMKREIRLKAEAMMQQSPQHIPSLLSLLAISRNLERIADHATNIAEDVIYMVEGRIIRHTGGE